MSVVDEQVIVASAPFGEVASLQGRPFTGSWFAVERDRLEEFVHASYTRDNPVELDEASYPEDLVEGFHLLALLDHLVNPVVFPTGRPWFGWNYGMDRVRFLSPVRAGERMRVSGRVAEVRARREGWVVLLSCEVHVAGREKPAFVADWRVFWLPAGAA